VVARLAVRPAVRAELGDPTPGALSGRPQATVLDGTRARRRRQGGEGDSAEGPGQGRDAGPERPQTGTSPRKTRRAGPRIRTGSPGASTRIASAPPGRRTER
jgi:hypothetical protein